MRISEVMKESELVPNVHCHIDKGLMEMTSAFYTCDRIFTTPIPLMYTRHTARFLLIWLLTVPMALYHEFRKSQTLYVPFIIPLISFFNAIFLFGIEELGVQIEEPFSILPLANICNDIQYAGEDLLAESNVPWFDIIEKEKVVEKNIPRIEVEKDKIKSQNLQLKDTSLYTKIVADMILKGETIKGDVISIKSPTVNTGVSIPLDIPTESSLEIFNARKELEAAVTRNISLSGASKGDLKSEIQGQSQPQGQTQSQGQIQGQGVKEGQAQIGQGVREGQAQGQSITPVTASVEEMVVAP